MSKSRLSVRNGSVALPTGYALDSQSFRVRETQGSIDTTIYGSNVYGQNTGTGTPTMRITAVGFPYKGTTGSNPGFGSAAAAGGDIGTTATFTLDTGCTIAGLFIAESIDADHSRIRPACMTTIELLNGNGDPTITWATT